MKNWKISFLALIVLALVFSCTKETTTPSVADTKGALLAGAKGGSKSWKLLSGSGSKNGGSAQALSFDVCFTDNIYTFTNNAAQSYQATEGAAKCDSADSTIVESGSWAFTGDGKSLLVDGTFFTPASSLFAGIGVPVTIVQLTSTSLQVSFTLSSSSSSYTYNLTFGSI
ncbi:MAG: hypothetical protein JSS79_11625 [Bacteroidetes bacterium]|nr:hypothetical protein [Bacteroidota bacterium]